MLEILMRLMALRRFLAGCAVLLGQLLRRWLSGEAESQARMSVITAVVTMEQPLRGNPRRETGYRGTG